MCRLLKKGWFHKRFSPPGQQIWAHSNSFKKLLEQMVPFFQLEGLSLTKWIKFYKLKNHKRSNWNPQILLILTSILTIKEIHWRIVLRKKRNMICKLKLTSQGLIIAALSRGIKASWRIHDYKLLIDKASSQII